MRRRTAVLVAGAAVAATAGAGTAWWQRSRTTVPPEPKTDLWSLSFDRPQGGAALAMSSLRGRPLLLNFWATWCVPCVTEMPLLDAFAKRSDLGAWQVLALAIDSIDPVRRFLADRSLALPVALAGNVGLDLSRSLGNGIGALPFTVVLDRSGQVVQKKLGAVDNALLDRWLAQTTST